MKRLITRSLIAAAAAALIALPLDAQTRSRGNARGGQGTESVRNGTGSQPARSGSNVRKRNNGAAPQQPQASKPQQQAPKPQNDPNKQKAQNNPPQNPNRQNPPQQAPTRPRSGNPPQAQPGGRPGNPPRNPQGRPQGRREPSPTQMRPGPGHNIERIPPRRRDPMPFGQAVRFWDRGRHYFGYRVSHLPRGYVRRVYRGITYYVLDGIYYRRYNGHYYVCRPPFGVFFDPVAEHLAYSACRFAYYYDVYNTYRTIDENAKVIANQNETIAANNATIARQNADIAINAERAASSYREADRLGLVQSYADAGTEYFYDDGVFFSKSADGKYVTIVPPAGALVRELPDDYETIVLDGTEYCKVDDTVYRMTVVDGVPYFEVFGQMSGTLATQYDPYNS